VDDPTFTLMIALVGNLSRDHVPGHPPRVGGGVYHGARALRLLDVQARIVARCAEADRAGLVPQLAQLGTPVRYVPGLSTATFAFSYDGDKRTMEVEALGDEWTPADLLGLPPFPWVHVAALSRHEFPAETLAALARSRRISLDGQGLVRAPAVGPLRLDADFDPELLRHVWVLKLAEDEAEVIGDPTALGVRELLITRGSRGSTVYWGGRSEVVAAHPIAADPTGSGDAFSVAYVVARHAGFAPPSAARRATAVVAEMLAAR
jgi:sugar/nucleoside kinase (ribokinase family)